MMSTMTTETDQPHPAEAAAEAVRVVRTPAWVKLFAVAAVASLVALGSVVADLDLRLRALGSPAGTGSMYEQPAQLGQFIERVKRSVVEVGCGEWSGTGWAIDLEPPTDPDELALYEEFPYSVLTNEHVITNCVDHPRSVTITVDDVESRAYLYSWDAKRDLALLMVKPELPGLEVGQRPEPGYWVMTVGNPFDLQQVVSIGNVMQLDGIDLVNSAPVNHGNSGGPLVNARGRVIGLTTWVMVADESDPTDVPQDWNVATTIPALCKEIIACEGDPQWTWQE